jgi:hypothetical protein
MDGRSEGSSEVRELMWGQVVGSLAAPGRKGFSTELGSLEGSKQRIEWTQLVKAFCFLLGENRQGRSVQRLTWSQAGVHDISSKLMGRWYGDWGRLCTCGGMRARTG